MRAEYVDVWQGDSAPHGTAQGGCGHLGEKGDNGLRFALAVVDDHPGLAFRALRRDINLYCWYTLKNLV